METTTDSALHRILEHVSFSDRKICRQVWKRWKTEIDTEIGLSIRIDDRRSKADAHDLLTFFYGVTSPKVTISHLNYTDSEWLDFHVKPTTKTLIFTGYVNPQFVRFKFLKNPIWKHLTKIYYHGRFLISQHLVEKSGDTTWTYGKFPCLRELHFSLARLDRRYPQKPLDENDNAFWDREVATRISGNMDYLLNSMQCDAVRVFVVAIDCPVPFRLEILYQFIERHFRTLEQVIVRDLKEAEPDTSVIQFGQIIPERHCVLEPKMLKSIYVSKMNAFTGNAKYFWTELMCSQNYLEEIFLTFNQFPVEIFPSFLMILACRNFCSLKYLTLKAEQNVPCEKALELDLDMLSGCEQLEVLVISAPNSGFSSSFKLRNINHLPQSLKVFKSEFPTMEDFYGSAFLNDMENLEELSLDNVQPIGLMGMDKRAFLQTALRHRRLNVLNVKFLEPDTPELPISPLKQFQWNDNVETSIKSLYIGGTEMSHGTRLDPTTGINYLSFRNYFDLLEHGTERNSEIFARQPFPCTYVLSQDETKEIFKRGEVKPSVRKLLRALNFCGDSISSSLGEYREAYSNFHIADVTGYGRQANLKKKSKFAEELNKGEAPSAAPEII